MPRRKSWLARLADGIRHLNLQEITDALTGTTRPRKLPDSPPRKTTPTASPGKPQVPPRRRSVNEQRISSESSYADLERAALNRIDSFRLDDLPDRISVDKKGHRHVHAAEYNRERVYDRLTELPKLMLVDIASMDRDQFRSWCVLNGFFYH